MTETRSLKPIEKALPFHFSNTPETSCLISDMNHVDRLLQNTICFSTVTQILHRNEPCVFFCLSKQNSLSQPTLCVPSWKTRAKATNVRLGSNATCTSRQTALGVRSNRTAGTFGTTEMAAPASVWYKRHIKLQAATCSWTYCLKCY
jgi:hypothetical protein